MAAAADIGYLLLLLSAICYLQLLSAAAICEYPGAIHYPGTGSLALCSIYRAIAIYALSLGPGSIYVHTLHSELLL